MSIISKRLFYIIKCIMYHVHNGSMHVTFRSKYSREKWCATASGREVFNFLICLLYFIFHFHGIYTFFYWKINFNMSPNAKCVFYTRKPEKLKFKWWCAFKEVSFDSFLCFEMRISVKQSSFSDELIEQKESSLMRINEREYLGHPK